MPIITNKGEVSINKFFEKNKSKIFGNKMLQIMPHWLVENANHFI